MKTLVFIEQRDGKIRKASLEALSLARKLSGGPVAAVLPGKGVTALAKDLGKYGAGVVYVADRDELALYSTAGYVGALDAATKKENPDAVLIAATSMGKDVAPRFAARHDSGVLADVMDLRLEGNRLVGSRPVYSGKARAEVDTGASKLQIATTRPNVFAAEADGAAADPKVEALEMGAIAPRARVVQVEVPESKELDVAEADVIVSGGRGIKGPENWPMIRDLQHALGAALGASRAVVDAGWIDHQHQVGQTGKVVSPTLYVACGISGAIQHLAGMGTSKVIVALNKDPEAPIFQVATYGIVGDIFQTVPELTKAVRAAKAE
jgi:electron transfer flavoprotein alpha subunit